VPPPARIVGVYEHPRRIITDMTVPELHADVALGALADAGLSLDDVDAYYCASDAPGLGPFSMAEYLNLKLKVFNCTDLGGASAPAGVGEAARAIAAGRCSVALITSAGLPRQAPYGRSPDPGKGSAPENLWEPVQASTNPALYALCATRHMYEFGTTSRDLAEVKVASAWHASHNPDALLPKQVSVEDVLESPLISDPLHRLDCCVITDGGGSIVVAAPEIAAQLSRPSVAVRGSGTSLKNTDAGAVDLTYTSGVISGQQAFGEARVRPADIQYASIYDSYTITVLMNLESLGFCAHGEGGRFVRDGALHAPHGRLPINTDGGGLSSNHPANRGGVTKVIEAVRQLRGEANEGVQVPGCTLALAHGAGGHLGTRMAAATVVLERDQ
jgi:acetyl-CoA C-acetyltransferase